MFGSKQRLEQVLAGQHFPADRWELITSAEAYGADNLSLAELHALPAVRFRTFADVLHAVQRGRVAPAAPRYARSA